MAARRAIPRARVRGGEVLFVDGSRLHIREFVQWTPAGPYRYMYVYHYQRSDNTLVFRYDNSAHYPDLPGAPHHKHVGTDEVQPMAGEPGLECVLDLIEDQLSEP
jgi:hypothetical protein